MKEFTQHVRSCATCSATRLPELMCAEGQAALNAINSRARGGLTKRALDYIETNEYGGREWDADGAVVHVCLDCGAQKGNPHSPDGCETFAILHAAGRR